MKYKYLFFVTFSFVCFLGITSLGYMQSNSIKKLDLTVDSSKKIYKLGEIVALSFKLKNKSNEDVSFMDSFGTATGYLTVYISQNGENFRRYEHSRWGLLDIVGVETLLKPNQSVETTATVFWSWKGDSSEYTFPNSNIYYIKARYSTLIEGQEDAVLVESEPIQIRVEKPTGEDLEVWNRIRGNGDIAYLIQEDDFRTSDAEKRAKLKQEAEDIFSQYPTSLIAKRIGQSLERLQANEEKRKAYLEKMKTNKPN